MAEGQDESEKTEEPTQKRLDDARKKGDVPKSVEVSGFFLLAAGAVVVAGLSGPMAASLSASLSGYFAYAAQTEVATDAGRSVFFDTVRITALALAAPIAVLVIASVIGHLSQTGFVVSAEKMKPKLSKLDPIAGVKRMLGPQGASNFLKGLAKLGIVGAAGFLAVWPRRDELGGLVAMDLAALLPFTRDVVVVLLLATLAAYLVVAAVDYVAGKASWMKRQRMSRRDIKDEHKQADGDPQVKARLRQIRQEKSRRRMLAAVPDAAVVITNPTHYAVALKYVQGETAAPICVAKGADALALRIRQVAKENDVPIYEDPPTARALFATAELDRPIPREHYAAVAKIIGYVLSLARRHGASRRATS